MPERRGRGGAALLAGAGRRRRSSRCEWDEGALAGLDSRWLWDDVREARREARQGGARRRRRRARAGSGARRIVEAVYRVAVPRPRHHGAAERHGLGARRAAARCGRRRRRRRSRSRRRARITGLPPEAITVHTTLLGGGFGRRGRGRTSWPRRSTSPRALKKPVKVIWSREDDMTQRLLPADDRTTCSRGAVDARRQHRRRGSTASSPSRSSSQGRAASGCRPSSRARPCRGLAESARRAAAGACSRATCSPIPTSVEGAADFAYAIPNLRVEYSLVRPDARGRLALASATPERVRRRELPRRAHPRRRQGSVPAPGASCSQGAAAHRACSTRRQEGGLGHAPARRASSAASPRPRASAATAPQVAEVSGRRQQGARAPRGRRHRLRPGGQPGSGPRPDRERHHLRPRRRAEAGDHLRARAASSRRNFHEFPPLRMHEMPEIEVHIVPERRAPHRRRRARAAADRAALSQRHLRGDRQAHPHAAHRESLRNGGRMTGDRSWAARSSGRRCSRAAGTNRARAADQDPGEAAFVDGGEGAASSPRCRNCHPLRRRALAGGSARAARHEHRAAQRGRRAPVHDLPPRGQQRRWPARRRARTTGTCRPATTPMVFEGRTPHELCGSSRTRRQNGGRNLAELHDHVAHDALVLGLDPGPRPQAGRPSRTRSWCSTSTMDRRGRALPALSHNPSVTPWPPNLRAGHRRGRIPAAARMRALGLTTVLVRAHHFDVLQWGPPFRLTRWSGGRPSQ